MNPGDRRAIYHLIAHFRPRRVLEIGTHVAASTIYIASALRRFVSGGKLTTADILDVNGPLAAWKSVGMSAPPAQYVAQLGLQNITEFVKCPASEALASRKRFDLIFLDGDHSRQAVYREISSALASLNPEGLILLHDFYPGGKPLTRNGDAIAGPSSAALRISQEAKDVAFIPLGNLPWPTKAGGNGTSLALVAKGSRSTS
jgi:predicted O-methyltransferase YrrM